MSLALTIVNFVFSARKMLISPCSALTRTWVSLSVDLWDAAPLLSEESIEVRKGSRWRGGGEGRGVSYGGSIADDRPAISPLAIVLLSLSCRHTNSHPPSSRKRSSVGLSNRSLQPMLFFLFFFNFVFIETIVRSTFEAWVDGYMADLGGGEGGERARARERESERERERGQLYRRSSLHSSRTVMLSPLLSPREDP